MRREDLPRIRREPAPALLRDAVPLAVGLVFTLPLSPHAPALACSSTASENCGSVHACNRAALGQQGGGARPLAVMEE